VEAVSNDVGQLRLLGVPQAGSGQDMFKPETHRGGLVDSPHGEILRIAQREARHPRELIVPVLVHPREGLRRPFH
jgi:hypothetical protein